MTGTGTPPLVDVASAAGLLREGAVLAYPTEAVWGLGCDPFDEAAVYRLLRLKHRAVEKGLILVAAAPAQLDGLLDWPALPDARRRQVLDDWPGPHTWVVPATAQVPAWIRGRHDSVAVRVSAHPVVKALCLAFDGPLVSTSANLAGHPAVAAREALDAALLAGIDAVVAGETARLARPTPIRLAATGARLRD